MGLRIKFLNRIRKKFEDRRQAQSPLLEANDKTCQPYGLDCSEKALYVAM